MPIPVLLAETDLLFCAGVSRALKANQNFVLRQPCPRDQETLEAALNSEPGAIAVVSDALIRDLPHLGRLAQEQQSALILLTAGPEPSELTELPAVRGSLRRNSDSRQLLACLQSVAAGKRWCTPPSESARGTTGRKILAKLSPREVQVMSGVSRGAKNVEIARELGTSEQVVKNMLGGIYDLAGVSDRLELALFVLHHPELAEAARRASGHLGPSLAVKSESV